MTAAEVRALVRGPDFSHVSYRSWCGVDLLHFYRRAPESPSHCELIGSCGDTPEMRALIAAEGKRAPQRGGQMGSGR